MCPQLWSGVHVQLKSTLGILINHHGAMIEHKLVTLPVRAPVCIYGANHIYQIITYLAWLVTSKFIQVPIAVAPFDCYNKFVSTPDTSRNTKKQLHLK